MKKRISDKKLKSFYRLLSVPMIDFDCGELCAPKNGGVPVCCENEDVVPVLFHEEYAYHWKNGRFWKRMPPATKEIKQFIEESEDYYVFARCPGAAKCDREKRSLNCRTFPLEPYLNKEGELAGLAYADARQVDCPLIGRPMRIFNREFLRNALTFWEEMFELYPEEKEMYMEESRKKDRRIRRARERLKKLNIYRKK